MNRLSPFVSRPAPSKPTDARPRAAAFGQPPPLSVRVSTQATARHLVRRPFATSRIGYDHSWIGLLLLTALLFIATTSSATAADPLGTWTKVTIPDTAIKSVSDMIFANGNYCATGRVQYSHDGATWNVVQTPATPNLNSIVFAQGRYVAVGAHLTILSSPNGTNWTLHYEADAAVLNTVAFTQVIYAGGKFVAVANKGQVYTSTNGTDWTPGAMPATVKMYVSGVTWGNGLFVASGETDGYYCIATSPDAITWTRRYISVGWGFKSIGFINGLFVAGDTSELFTSPDGVTWTKLQGVTFKYSNTSVAGIKFVNGRLFAFGNSGLVMSSTNGTDWTTHETNTTLDITALDYSGDRVLIFRVGIISSGNGPAKSDPWAPIAVDPVDPVDPNDPNAAAQIANISTRAWIGTGDTKLITGFVVSGTTPKKVLIRGVGPTLGAFGVPGTVVNPMVTLYNRANQEVASNNDWSNFADQAALAAESKCSRSRSTLAARTPRWSSPSSPAATRCTPRAPTAAPASRSPRSTTAPPARPAGS